MLALALTSALCACGSSHGSESRAEIAPASPDVALESSAMTAATQERATPSSTLPAGIVPAFPGAQGGGALSKGGRGGAVYEVTNLNDSGAGSLRACVQGSGPRTCVFRVSGNIKLLDSLWVRSPYLTVAGQTAPGGGIVLDGRSLDNHLVRVYTHDVTWRYTRIRKGYYARATEQRGDVVAVKEGSKNVIFDHNSISWTQDENVGIEGEARAPPRNVTFSWNLISEPLAAHPTSIMTGGASTAGMVEIDFHHNMIANSSHRNPLITTPHTRLVNNLLYNWSYYATQFNGSTRSDVIGNLYRRGPITPTRGSRIHEVQCYPGGGTPSLYVAGNQGPFMRPDADNWSAVYEVNRQNGAEVRVLSTRFNRTTPMEAPVGGIAIVADPVSTLESKLLPIVGASRRLDCNGRWVRNRDAVDTRLMTEYKARAGFLPTTEAEVGGFPAIASGTACADADRDGMPDAWEAANGSNPNDTSDRNTVMPDGFTRLEHYLTGR